MGATAMRRKVATAIVMLALLVMAGVPAKADASTPDPSKSDLSSIPEIEAYLFSIGVDPGSVVVQQGRFNYAGPNCPGADWNCTAANMVVQITSSTLPAANVFDCLPTLNALIPALNECLIVQSSASSLAETANTMNDAHCTMSGNDAKQKCKVKQSSKKGSNYAEVRATSTQRGAQGLQTATQGADIEQTSESGRNTAKITQTIDQSLNVGTPDDPTQQQQANQTAKITQNSGSGNNSADLQQTMLQSETAQSNADIMQDENQNSSPGPNQDASISQSSSSGSNWANLAGQLTQRQSASCGSCSITQREGVGVPGSGQKGRVDQTTLTGTTNQGTGKQVEDQRQDASSSTTPTQLKAGPQDCCLRQTGGGGGNIGTVTLLNLHMDNQGLMSSGTSVQLGDCTAAAGQKCTLDETYTYDDGIPHHFSGTGQMVTHDRSCSGANPEGTFSSCSDEG